MASRAPTSIRVKQGTRLANPTPATMPRRKNGSTRQLVCFSGTGLLGPVGVLSFCSGFSIVLPSS